MMFLFLLPLSLTVRYVTKRGNVRHSVLLSVNPKLKACLVTTHYFAQKLCDATIPPELILSTEQTPVRAPLPPTWSHRQQAPAAQHARGRGAGRGCSPPERLSCPSVRLCSRPPVCPSDKNYFNQINTCARGRQAPAGRFFCASGQHIARWG